MIAPRLCFGALLEAFFEVRKNNRAKAVIPEKSMWTPVAEGTIVERCTGLSGAPLRQTFEKAAKRRSVPSKTSAARMILRPCGVSP